MKKIIIITLVFCISYTTTTFANTCRQSLSTGGKRAKTVSIYVGDISKMRRRDLRRLDVRSLTRNEVQQLNVRKLRPEQIRQLNIDDLRGHQVDDLYYGELTSQQRRKYWKRYR